MIVVPCLLSTVYARTHTRTAIRCAHKRCKRVCVGTQHYLVIRVVTSIAYSARHRQQGRRARPRGEGHTHTPYRVESTLHNTMGELYIRVYVILVGGKHSKYIACYAVIEKQYMFIHLPVTVQIQFNSIQFARPPKLRCKYYLWFGFRFGFGFGFSFRFGLGGSRSESSSGLEGSG